MQRVPFSSPLRLITGTAGSHRLADAAQHPGGLSVPSGAHIVSCARMGDAAVYRIGDESRVQFEGVTAPIEQEAEGAWGQLCVEHSLGHIRAASLRRFVGLLPGAFSFAT